MARKLHNLSGGLIAFPAEITLKSVRRFGIFLAAAVILLAPFLYLSRASNSAGEKIGVLESALHSGNVPGPGLNAAVTAAGENPENSSEILVSENFEGEKFPVVDYEELGGFYDLHGYPDLMYITDKEAAAGSQSLELIHPQGVISPQWIHRKFPGRDSVFVRFYRKWEKDWVFPVLGAHDVLIFAGKYDSPVSTDLSLYLDLPQGPTIRNGKDNWDLSGQPELVLKSSFQGQGLDFGTGKEVISHVGFDNYYGLPYNKKEAPILEGGRWYCFEFMVRMNSAPQAKDGTVRLWIDGALITEMTGLTLRNAGHMDIQWDHWMLGPRYGGKEFKTGPPKGQKSWFDELVIATRYIGPSAGMNPGN